MLTLTCTLHGSLEDYLDESLESNQIELQFEHAPSVKDVLKKLKINRDYLQFALANGHYITVKDWGLAISGDHIQLWPRVAGG